MKHCNFNTNENLKQLTDSTLIIGVDIAKRSHVARATDYRGIELSKTMSFDNNIRGFREFHQWIRQLTAIHKKSDIIVGMEPTGPYGHTLAQFLSGIELRVVLVLGQQVNRAKELDDNTPSKSDAKDAYTIAKLISEGRFRRLREFDENISSLKEAMSYHIQLTKKLTRVKCQIDNWLTQRFPEFSLVFADWEKKTAIVTLNTFPLPSEINRLSAEEIVTSWREGGIHGCIGIKKARVLKHFAQKSTGLTKGLEFARIHMDGLLGEYELLYRQLDGLWEVIDILLRDIPLVGTISSIPHISQTISAGIAAELGDISDFSHPKQLSRLAGLSLKESSSGKRCGRSVITKRGRPHLRHWLYLAVLEMLKRKEPTFWALHMYYTNRRDNPLKPMQSVIALCNKLLRVIFGMITKHAPYNPSLVTSGIPVLNTA